MSERFEHPEYAAYTELAKEMNLLVEHPVINMVSISKDNHEIAGSTVQGDREYQQDVIQIHENILPGADLALVTDGFRGVDVAEYVHEVLPEVMKSVLGDQEIPKDIADAKTFWKDIFSQVMVQVQDRVYQNTDIFENEDEQLDRGCTFTGLLMLDDYHVMCTLGDSPVHGIKAKDSDNFPYKLDKGLVALVKGIKANGWMQEDPSIFWFNSEACDVSKKTVGDTTFYLETDLVTEFRLTPEVKVFDPQKYKTYLLCSDGLAGRLYPHKKETLGELLATLSPKDATVKLTELAYSEGSTDNISCLVIENKQAIAKANIDSMVAS